MLTESGRPGNTGEDFLAESWLVARWQDAWWTRGSHESHYGDSDVAFLERLWGEGHLSPGGPDEVRRIVDGLDLDGATVLDLGCGTGGIAVSLVADHGAAQGRWPSVELKQIGRRVGFVPARIRVRMVY